MVNDPFERAAVFGAGLLMAAFFVAVTVGAFGLGIRVPTCVTDLPPFDQPAQVEVAPGQYVVNVVAQMWAFNPREIRIPVGSTVTFNVTSKDVQHGFFIVGKNVNLMAVPRRGEPDQRPLRCPRGVSHRLPRVLRPGPPRHVGQDHRRAPGGRRPGARAGRGPRLLGPLRAPAERRRVWA